MTVLALGLIAPESASASASASVPAALLPADRSDLDDLPKKFPDVCVAP